jgi:hypothetical protein
MFMNQLQHLTIERRKPRFQPSVEALEARDVPASTVTIMSSANPAQFGQPITFTVNVSGSNDVTAGIALYDGSTNLGLNTGGTGTGGNGTYTWTISSLSPGLHQLHATYTGIFPNFNHQDDGVSSIFNQFVNAPPPPSVLPIVPLSGDVTQSASIQFSPILGHGHGHHIHRKVTITNNGTAALQGPLFLVVPQHGKKSQQRSASALVKVTEGSLLAGQSLTMMLTFPSKAFPTGARLVAGA